MTQKQTSIGRPARATTFDAGQSFASASKQNSNNLAAEA